MFVDNMEKIQSKEVCGEVMEILGYNFHAKDKQVRELQITYEKNWMGQKLPRNVKVPLVG